MLPGTLEIGGPISTLTRHQRRVPRKCRRRLTPPSRFQPSPAIKGGCHSLILTITELCDEFQPSPAIKGGCHAGAGMTRPSRNDFNPHPPSKAGATRPRETRGVRRHISTLTRHQRRVPPIPLVVCYTTAVISTLTRHQRRVPQIEFFERVDGRRISTLTRHQRRVPPPADPEAQALSMISTLTRHQRRVPHWRPGARMGRLQGFQPSPAIKGGCHVFTLASNGGNSLLFQPSPAIKGGCHRRAARDKDHGTDFNPHPPSKAGATGSRFMGWHGCRYFNPHPPSKAGATVGRNGDGPGADISTLTRHQRRVPRPSTS